MSETARELTPEDFVELQKKFSEIKHSINNALAVMMALPFLLGKAHASNLAPLWPSISGEALRKGIGVALVGILWAYDGWVNTSALAEEVRDPGRNIPRAMAGGMAFGSPLGAILAPVIGWRGLFLIVSVAGAGAMLMLQSYRGVIASTARPMGMK